MSQAEYARHRGVTRQAISKAVAAGKIPLKERGGRMLIDAAEADFAISETRERINLDEPAPAPPPAMRPELPDRPAAESSTAGLTKAKTANEVYRAKLAELEYNQRIGNLSDNAAVDRNTFDVFRRVRDRMLGLPAAVAEKIVAAPDARAARMILEEEIRKALGELTEDLERAYAEAVDAA